MGFFRNSKKQTIAELEDYYAGKKYRSNAKAWFMAFLSLVVTVAILTMLFFGGRWIYRKLFNNDSNVKTTSLVTGRVKDTSKGPFDDNDTDASFTGDDNKTNSSDPIIVNNSQDNKVDTDSSSSGTVSDQAASTTRQPSESDINDSDTSASTTKTNIPNTGAGDILLVIPLVTIALGYFISRKNQLSS